MSLPFPRQYVLKGSHLVGFPWHDLIPGSIVVDVGGGIGSTSMLLANAFPDLRFVVQDRPPVVEMGAAVRLRFAPAVNSSAHSMRLGMAREEPRAPRYRSGDVPRARLLQAATGVTV